MSKCRGNTISARRFDRWCFEGFRDLVTKERSGLNEPKQKARIEKNTLKTTRIGITAYGRDDFGSWPSTVGRVL